ncbi:hypothetical protein AGOR_G00099700 [Albula goreensis]|uniref:Uncharacterized protein n=1 Tax=Albula goreensis TaxID=1534307 RepID=A0A8T3DNH5_9TELE|nr:hypothetical protein AGOR_G00099700 [Albula goreensis]
MESRAELVYEFLTAPYAHLVTSLTDPAVPPVNHRDRNEEEKKTALHSHSAEQRTGDKSFPVASTPAKTRNQKAVILPVMPAAAM